MHVPSKMTVTDGASPDLLSGPHSVMPPVTNNEALYAGGWSLPCWESTRYYSQSWHQ